MSLDLSKYFDTLDHEMLLNILRRNVKDERVIQWIKRYLKSGVMENGVVMETEEGSPQGGNISPLLANIYLNEFDQEFEKRKVAFVRYADDIVILAKSGRAAKRLLEKMCIRDRPRPTTILRSARSFISTQRFQTTCLVSILRAFPCCCLLYTSRCV